MTAPALALALLAGLAVVTGMAGTTDARASEIRAAAEVDCQPAGKALEYACAIRLSDRRSGEPLEGVELTVGATMPSMPMAHNVRPVKAKAGDASGNYAAVLELEMYGTWALQLDLTGPLRDRIIATLDFQPGDSAADKNPKGHGGHNRH